MLEENKWVGIVVVVYGNSMVIFMVEVVMEFLGSIFIIVIDVFLMVFLVEIVDRLI